MNSYQQAAIEEKLEGYWKTVKDIADYRDTKNLDVLRVCVENIIQLEARKTAILELKAYSE